MGMRELGPTLLTPEQTGRFSASEHQEYTWCQNYTSERIENHKWDNSSKIFCILKIQNQVTKRQLTFIGKVTCNSDKQLPTKILTAWCNNKRRVGGVFYSNKKIIVQNITIIVPTVDRYGSLKFWAYLDSDDKYWKYLINGIVNAPTPPQGSPPSPTTEREQPPSPPSPYHSSQAPPTSPPPRQITRPSPIPSPRYAPTSPRSQTWIYDTKFAG